MRDIESRADIEAVLRAFYARAFDDALLAHIFIEVAHMDLEEHLPVIGSFWEKVLFNTGAYMGDAMGLHRHLHGMQPLTPAHFERWLSLWTATIDDQARRTGRRCGPAARRADRVSHAAQPARSPRPRTDPRAVSRTA